MSHSQPFLLHTETLPNVTPIPNLPGTPPTATAAPVGGRHTKPRLPIRFTQPFYHAAAQPGDAKSRHTLPATAKHSVAPCETVAAGLNLRPEKWLTKWLTKQGEK